jgi:general secretion pathway protein B
VSFILDALRKSEHQRQRQTGPGLAEVPVATAKPKTNVWATAAISLLVVNLTAVGVLLLRRAQQQDAIAAPSASTTAGAAADTMAAAPAANPTLAPVPAQPPAVTQSATPPVPRPVASEPVGRNPLADEVGGADPVLQAAASAVPAGPPAVVKNGGTKRGSVVYAPIPAAEDAPYVPPGVEPTVRTAPPPVTAPARDSLPDADELTARGSLPALHLDLHVYAAQPQQRFIFVNSRKYREGETLAEGPLIEQITADGAVLNFRGSRFKLANN